MLTQTKKGQVNGMNKKQTYVAPSADVLFNLGDFILGSNDLPGDEFHPGDTEANSAAHEF